MAKKRDKQVLYELIGKANYQPDSLKKGSRRTRKARKDRKVTDSSPFDSSAEIQDRAPGNDWPPRPGMISRFRLRLHNVWEGWKANDPYTRKRVWLGIVFFLAVCCVLLLVIQSRFSNNDTLLTPVEDGLNQPSGPALVSNEKPAQPEKLELGPIRDHIIIIQEYSVKRDLIPAQAFFLEHGIETEIQQRGDRFFLITKDRFESPRRKETDGYRMLQKIREVGPKYKAPTGYETFGKKPFHDAYGDNVSR